MASETHGTLALVLHAHQPFVLGHERWPHGGDWLCEAVTECYLPLLRTLGSLVERGMSPQLTLSFSPVLCEQLASPLLQHELQFFLDTRLRACADTRRHFQSKDQADEVALVSYWERFYRTTLDQLDRLGGDLLAAFRSLVDDGHLELITSAATHAYLPLLASEQSVRLQLRLATDSYETFFGRRPQGMWLPECGYRPRYHWIPPVGTDRQQRRSLRRGLEEHLAACGVAFFFVDGQSVLGGHLSSPYRDYFPSLTNLRDASREEWTFRQQVSPYETYRVSSRGGAGTAQVFLCDPESSRLVWNRTSGYPGDPWYLDFHKQHYPGGLKLWRVSEATADLSAKAPYLPERARAQAQTHARHFVTQVSAALTNPEQADVAAGLVCAAYDAELFGHWWHEGPHWLECVYPELRRHGLTPTTCSAALDRCPPSRTISLPEGSWGEGGDHRTWLNTETAWGWERLYDGEFQFWNVVQEMPETAHGELLRRVLCQAGRELLLMQASDWPFLITARTARDYAEQRFLGHYTDLKRLLQIARSVHDRGQLAAEEERFLESRERQNFLFPTLDQVLFR